MSGAAMAPALPVRAGLGRLARRHPAAVVAALLLLLIAAACIVGPWLLPHGPAALDWDHFSTPPGIDHGHYLGTDAIGRDILARTLSGGRLSLAVGLAATLVSLLIGVAWGATAGYLGGRVDAFMMRLVDVLYALPFMFFVILLMVFFGRHLLLIFVAIGAINWLDMARIVRGQTIALKNQPFIDAARVGGSSSARIIIRHIVPNLLGVVAVYVTLTIPVVILAESFLSFLGLGVQEPLTSLGNLISNGARDMEIAPWTLIAPAATMMLTLFCFNFLGDGLRDAIDPKDR